MPTLAKQMREWGRRHLRETTRKYAGASKPDVVATIQSEAKAAGATLKSEGKGGLDPELALKVFRRDKWRCGVPNCKTPKENLDLDHIGGHEHELTEDPEADAWLKAEAKKGKRDEPDAIHVLCARHHDMVHQRDRAIEDGKKPASMKA